MKKIKVGILTVSDGREYLHEEYEPLNFRYQHELAAALDIPYDEVQPHIANRMQTCAKV